MYILFENYRNLPNYFWQRIMAIGGKGEWVHCEIVFNEMNNKRASAWGSEGMNIVEWEKIDKPEYFELYALPSELWKPTYNFMLENKGKKYDKIGVLGMIYGIPVQDKNAKFCSEICYEAIQQFTSIDLPTKKAYMISPLKLRRMLREIGLKPVPLSVLNK